MKWQTLIHYTAWGIFLLLPACGGGSSYTPATQATIQTQAMSPGYPMGPGMQHNFGLLRDNVGQMHGMMGHGGMSPEYYNHTMGQMGGMMQEMGSPYYDQEMEHHHQQQLEEMHRYMTR